MKRIGFLIAMTALLAFVAGDAFARGGRGGGGGGARGGGGGGARVGGGGGARPSGGSRPSMPSGGGRSPSISGGARPSAPAQRPSGGGAQRPSTGNIARPGTGAGGVQRPGTGNVARPGTGVAGRPTAGQLNNFLDVPRPSTGAIGAGGAIAGGALAGNAAADFLRDSPAGAARPGQLPANRPGAVTLPATRPGEGGIAGNRPGAGGPGDRPGAGNLPATRPGEGGLAGNRPGAGNLPANRPGEGGIAGNRPGDRPGNAGDRQDNRQDRRQDFANNRPDRVQNRQGRVDDRMNRRDEIRDQVRDNYPRLDFWHDHPGWAAWRINAPYRWATWGALTGWFGWGAYEPVYCDYGTTVYYQEGAVYNGDQQIATEEQYTEQAAALVESAPETIPATSEWMPLGVFALTQDGQATGGSPTMFLQLAVNKDAVIVGTFKNMLSGGETQTVEGAIDKKTQRAAWCVKGKTRPIMETALANLTQDTAPCLIHFADDQTQQWLMVRLSDPQATPGATGAQAPAATPATPVAPQTAAPEKK